MDHLKDVQSESATINTAIDKVGIRNLPVRFNIRLWGRDNVQGTASLYTDLNDESRGTHMSRLVQTCLKAARRHDLYDFQVIVDCLSALKYVLQAKNAYIKFRFAILVDRKAPTTLNWGFVKFDAELEGEIVDGIPRLYFKCDFPYISLCACSKAISVSGAAHNQRSIASIRLEIDYDWVLSIECSGLDRLLVHLQECVTAAASSDIYPVMKRTDEKHVVDTAYEHPAFVEDVGRTLVAEIDKLRPGALKMVKNFVVVIEHQESIHQHDAIAVVRRGLL